MNIFVDGTSGPKKESGKSGWGLCAMIGPQIIARQCGYSKSRETTNAMELEALLRGIGFAAVHRAQATVWVDSAYTAKLFQQCHALHASDYRRKGKRIPNADRIELLYEMLYEFGWINLVSCRWTKGHKGAVGNEEADKLAHAAAYEGQTIDEKN